MATRQRSKESVGGRRSSQLGQGGQSLATGSLCCHDSSHSHETVRGAMAVCLQVVAVFICGPYCWLQIPELDHSPISQFHKVSSSLVY